MLHNQAENFVVNNRGKHVLTPGLRKKEKALQDVKNTVHLLKTPGLVKGPYASSSCNYFKPLALKTTATKSSGAFEIYTDDELGHDHAKCEAEQKRSSCDELRLPQSTISYYGNRKYLFVPKAPFKENNVILTPLPEIDLKCKPPFIHDIYDDSIHDLEFQSFVPPYE